ncbi:MAG: DUF1573 domain-containing protein [Chthoniobacterales bacterium]
MNLTAKALLSALFLGALSTVQAQLAWEKTEIELHPKPGDAEAVANFKYENKTAKPIQIKNVHSSCGCTVASLKKNEVAPGEKGEVTATFKIGGRTGLQQKTITVETDDSTQPVTNLLLKAVIPEAVQIQPAFVHWDSGQKPTPQKITVTAGPGTTLTKIDVTSTPDEFTTKVDPGSKAGEFVITVTPKDVSKMSTATLTIKGDLPQVFYATARITAPSAAGR